MAKGKSHQKARIIRGFVRRFFGSRDQLRHGEETPDDQSIFNHLEVPEELQKKVWDAIRKQEQKVSGQPAVSQGNRVDEEGSVFSNDSGISITYLLNSEPLQGETKN